MTDNIKKFAGVFGDELAQAVDLPGHKFVKVSASMGKPHPDSPVIELKERPSLAELWEQYGDDTPSIGFVRGLIPGASDMVVVPVEVVEGWKARIQQLEQEIAAHGLTFSAVISNPGPEPWKGVPGKRVTLPNHDEQLMEELPPAGPACLYGRPLAWPEPSEMSRELPGLPRTGMSIKAAHGALEKQFASSPDYFGINGPTPSEWLAQQGPGKVMKGRQQIHFHSSMSEQELLAMLEETKAISAEPIATAITPTQAMMKSMAAIGERVRPYLLEDVYIESCPVIGKQAPEAIDLSGESI